MALAPCEQPWVTLWRAATCLLPAPTNSIAPSIQQLPVDPRQQGTAPQNQHSPLSCLKGESPWSVVSSPYGRGTRSDYLPSSDRVLGPVRNTAAARSLELPRTVQEKDVSPMQQLQRNMDLTELTLNKPSQVLVLVQTQS